jgi:transmembrane sensor
MEDNRLNTLFEKYINKDLDKSELAEFYSLIIQTKNDHYSNLFLDHLYANEQFNSIKQIIDEERVLANVLKVQTNPKLIPIEKNKLSWTKFVVAASILVATTFLIRYYLERKSLHLSELNAMQILPAKDKASLRLSNGEVVLLDTLQPGSTKYADGVLITKSADGEVIYEVVDAADNQGINELVTPNGGKYMLVLPDKTKVWLNAATSLKYPKQFNGDQRIVELQGEAYFEVAKIKNKAFVVKSGAQFVEVLGTHFNFNTFADNDLVTTTLLEGSVKTGNDKLSQIIRPGEKAEFGDEGAIRVSKADLESIMAWRNEEFIFKEKRLDLVLKEVSRWYDVEITINQDINADQIKLMGWVSRNKDLSAIIKNLETATGLTFIVKGRRVEVTK